MTSRSRGGGRGVRATTNTLRGIIFDFDGTIAETERFGHRVAYNRAFEECGLDWHWDADLYGELLGVAGGKERLRFYMSRYRRDGTGDAVDEALVADLHRAKVRHFVARAPEIGFRLGVRRLIAQAHESNVRIAIATTASQAGVEALLAQDRRIRPMIDVIAASESVERKKPAPDVYRWALDRMGVRAETSVAIEDSQIGLSAALAAGLPTVVTMSDYTKRDDFRGASAVLTSLGETDAPARRFGGVAPPAGVVDVAFLTSLLPGCRVIRT